MTSLVALASCIKSSSVPTVARLASEVPCGNMQTALASFKDYQQPRMSRKRMFLRLAESLAGWANKLTRTVTRMASDTSYSCEDTTVVVRLNGYSV